MISSDFEMRTQEVALGSNCKTTAGYQNLSKDFNVFLVGDATLATFPANDTPAHATNAAISFAAIDHLVTQVSWVKYHVVEKK